MESHLEGLSLLAEEDGGVTFDVERHEDSTLNLDLCLVGRLLIDISLRVHAMKERLPNIWRPGKGIFIKSLENCNFLFKIFHKFDMQLVFNGDPWTFDNHSLILDTIQPGDTLTEIPLNHVTFWVQVHDLPVGFMTQVVGQCLVTS